MYSLNKSCLWAFILTVGSVSLLRPGPLGAANTQLVSVTINNASGTMAASAPSMSADGSLVVFESFSDDYDSIVADNDDSNPPHDPQNLRDIFIWERNIGQVFLISASSDGSSSGDGSSFNPVISQDGDQVAFVSDAVNLDYPSPPNVDGIRDHIYLYDVSGQTTKLLTPNFKNNDGANGDSSDPSISNDGKVVFTTDARNLVDDKKLCDVNGSTEVYIYTGSVVKLISKSKKAPNTNPSCSQPGDNYDTMTANSSSSKARISRDGNFVAFVSSANDLIDPPVEAANDFDDDLFIYDVSGDSVSMITKNAAGDNGGDSGTSETPAISANGLTVVFESGASDLTAINDTLGNTDAFAWTQATGVVMLSVNTSLDNGGNGFSVNPSVSDDGTKVLFESNASDLVAGFDNNFTTQLYMQNLLLAPGVNVPVSVSLASETEGSDGSSFNARISGNGNYVAFQSTATNMTGGGVAPDGVADVFLRDLVNKVTFLMSPNDAATGGGDNASYDPQATSDGRYLLFSSDATDLLGGLVSDGNGATDIFMGEQPGVVQFSADTALGNEGDPGDTKTVKVTVTRSGGAAGAAQVDCKTEDDSAVAGGDYDDTTQTVTWSDGDMASKECTVNLVNDIQFENDEQFKIKLQNPSGVAIGKVNVNTVTVKDDDTTEKDCTDTNDNDADTDTDCDDSDCSSDPACIESACDDGNDNDGDGNTDCDDSDCSSAPNCIEAGNCTDGIDNDGDTFTDCADTAECAADPSCIEAGNCNDGKDNDLNGLTDCLDVAACSADQACQLCGNGTCNVAQGENNNNCPGDCPTPSCGNNACESGENNNNCSGDCPSAFCGNSACESGENFGTCPGDCATCGNNVCDAGETVGNCSQDCAVCGDSLITGAEACDDGGTSTGDGCNATCQEEPGYDCTGEPSTCSTTCGDGIVAGAEACDDSDTTPNDGCDGSCKVEASYHCAGSPSVCKLCGNNACESPYEDTNNCPGDCPAPASCGDNNCDPGENFGNCANDCNTCGNPSTCDAGETPINCASDCQANACGNNICDAGEDNASCSQDCPAIPVPEDCDNGSDDDLDNSTDCADSDCSADPACADGDGDGVLDANDNCPSVANNGQQNADGDSLGDACDPEAGHCNNGQDDDGDGAVDCADSECSAALVCADPTGDQDGDNLANATDNCPGVSNPDQADADNDGIGDACEGAQNPDGGTVGGGGPGGNNGGGGGPGGFPGDPRGGGGFGCSLGAIPATQALSAWLPLAGLGGVGLIRFGRRRR